MSQFKNWQEFVDSKNSDKFSQTANNHSLLLQSMNEYRQDVWNQVIGDQLVKEYSDLIETFENIDQDVLYMPRFWQNIENEAV